MNFRQLKGFLRKWGLWNFDYSEDTDEVAWIMEDIAT